MSHGRAREPAKRGRFAGFTEQSKLDDQPLESVYVLGLPVTLIRDDAAAVFIDSERHLLPWFEDEELKVDRYDARLLLDDLSALTKASKDRAAQAPQDVSEAELDEERYRDLDYALEYKLQLPAYYSEDLAGPGNEELEHSDASEHGQPREEDAGEAGSHRLQYAAIAFDYSTASAADALEGYEEHDDAADASAAAAGSAHVHEATAKDEELEAVADPYVPYFAVPEELHACLPKTERLHKIVVQTAKFVSANGGQVEVLLRVKQANNPNFGFLTPGHRIHPYYRWLLDAKPQELVKDAAPGAQYDMPQPAAMPKLPVLEHAPADHSGAVAAAAAAATTAGPSPNQNSSSALGQLLQAYGSQHLHLGSESQDLQHEVDSTAGSEDMDEGFQLPPPPLPSVHTCEPPPAPEPATASVAQAAHTLPAEATPAVAATTAMTVAATEPTELTSSIRTSTATAVVGPPAGQLTRQEGRAASPEPGVPGLDSSEDTSVGDFGPAGARAAHASQAAAEQQPTVDMDGTPLPPQDTRAIIDKLVAFVAKNGARFEAIVRQREKRNPQFSFLMPWNQWHAYYMRQLVAAMGKPAVDAMFVQQQQQQQQQQHEVPAAAGAADHAANQPAAPTATTPEQPQLQEQEEQQQRQPQPQQSTDDLRVISVKQARRPTIPVAEAPQEANVLEGRTQEAAAGAAGTSRTEATELKEASAGDAQLTAAAAAAAGVQSKSITIKANPRYAEPAAAVAGHAKKPKPDSSVDSGGSSTSSGATPTCSPVTAAGGSGATDDGVDSPAKARPVDSTATGHTPHAAVAVEDGDPVGSSGSSKAAAAAAADHPSPKADGHATDISKNGLLVSSIENAEGHSALPTALLSPSLPAGAVGSPAPTPAPAPAAAGAEPALPGLDDAATASGDRPAQLTMQQKLLQRRLRARLLLAQKGAAAIVEQQVAHEVQRARAILNHRQAFKAAGDEGFLGGEDDTGGGGGALPPGGSTSSPPVGSLLPQLQAVQQQQLQQLLVADDDTEIEEGEFWEPEPEPEPELEPEPAPPQAAKPTAAEGQGCGLAGRSSPIPIVMFPLKDLVTQAVAAAAAQRTLLEATHAERGLPSPSKPGEPGPPQQGLASEGRRSADSSSSTSGGSDSDRQQEACSRHHKRSRSHCSRSERRHRHDQASPSSSRERTHHGKNRHHKRKRKHSKHDRDTEDDSKHRRKRHHAEGLQGGASESHDRHGNTEREVSKHTCHHSRHHKHSRSHRKRDHSYDAHAHEDSSHSRHRKDDKHTHKAKHKEEHRAPAKHAGHKHKSRKGTARHNVDGSSSSSSSAHSSEATSDSAPLPPPPLPAAAPTAAVVAPLRPVAPPAALGGADASGDLRARIRQLLATKK